jgi:hypothetical protein
MKIYVLESDDWAKCPISKEDIGNLIETYAKESAGILKDVSPNLNIIIKPSLSHVSETKGVGGSAFDHELMDVTFDVAISCGIEKFKKHLRETVFHEMNHTMFMHFHPREERQLYWVVLEGLGTAFDRDYAEGEHFANLEATKEEKLVWLNQNLLALARSPKAPEDWGGMMYLVGTWIVDSATKKSGKNIIELTHLSCDEILELSEVK